MQKLDSVGITATVVTYPTAPIELILNYAVLYSVVQSVVKGTTVRLIKEGKVRRRPQFSDGEQTWDIRQIDMSNKFSSTKEFTTKLNNKSAWDQDTVSKLKHA